MLSLLKAIGGLLPGKAYYGQIPDSPDNLYVLNFYGGLEPERIIGNRKPSVRRLRLQVYVRNTSYEQGLENISDYRDVLIDAHGWLGNAYVMQFDQIADIYHVGRDDDKRYQFSINFYVMVDELKEE